MHLIDRALLLRRHPYSETSAVVSVLTREHGLVRILARGVHRPRSRFYAVLDYFDELELEWSPTKGGGLANLRAGRLLLRRRGITRDLDRYRAAGSILELAAVGARPSQVESPMFDLLGASLQALHLEAATPDSIRVTFQLEFLRLHGLFPALEQCAACGREAPATSGPPPRVGFSAGAGGRLCTVCCVEARASGKRVGTMPLDVLAVAAKMSRGEEHRHSPALLLRVRDFIERFLDYHLEARPRSHRLFLAENNRNAAQQPTTAGD
ncbi:MAG: DNA repair protein RecO (recombination protein O) [Planctomycetota bacterium]|jgi:DNA repair protein RecO (recombination protein O)